MEKVCHASLFKELARIVEHPKIKDVRLQIVFCKSNFLRLISNQDSGYVIMSERSMPSNPHMKLLGEVIQNKPKFELIYQSNEQPGYAVSIYQLK